MLKSVKKLRVHRETLTQLSPAELNVQGGASYGVICRSDGWIQITGNPTCSDVPVYTSFC